MSLTLAEILPAGDKFAAEAAEDIIKRVERHSKYGPRVTAQPETSDTESLTFPGGFVEEIVDWIVSSSERPSRYLALSAVLPFVGSLIGRRFESPTTAASN